MPKEILDNDDDLRAAIIEFLENHSVTHISDVTQNVFHIQSATYVREIFHQLMNEGSIVYKKGRYQI